MRSLWKWTLPVVLVVVGLATGLPVGQLEAQQKNILVARKVAAAPPMEPVMGETWKGAAPLTVKAIGGKNLPGGSTEVTLRAVYTADMVYFLIEYKDSTESLRRGAVGEAGRRLGSNRRTRTTRGGTTTSTTRTRWRCMWNINSPAFEQTRLLRRLPHRRGQALRQQVHGESRRAPGHVALEGRAHRHDRADRRPVRRPAPATTRTRPGSRAARAIRRPAAATANNVSDDKKAPEVRASRATSPRRPTGSSTPRRSRSTTGSTRPATRCRGIIVVPVHRRPGRHRRGKHVWKDGVRTVVICTEARDRQRVRRAVQRPEEGLRLRRWPCSTTRRCATPTGRGS